MSQGNSKLELDCKFLNSTEQLDSLFEGLDSCELSLSEALSLCYLAEYIRERFYKHYNYDFSVSVQIERSFHKSHELKEWYFGDGMVCWEGDSGHWRAMPVQETKAVNYTPQTSKRVIENEIVRVINKKTSDTKRKKYNNTCGLLVSVMPGVSNIDYKKILASINISNYNAVYLVEYSNGFKTGTVIDLLSHKNNVPVKPLTITPRLVKS